MAAFVTLYTGKTSTFNGKTLLKSDTVCVKPSTTRQTLVMRLGGAGNNGGLKGGSGWGTGSNKFGNRYKGGDGVGNGGVGGGKGRGGDGTFGAADRSGNPFEKAYAWYVGWLRSRPIITKMLTSFVGFFCADLLLQSIRGGGDATKNVVENMFVFGVGDVSIWGALQTAVFGAIFHGLFGHYYYAQLEGFLAGQQITQLLGKTLCDSLIWPPFLVATRLAYNKILKGGKEFGTLWDDIKGSRLTGNLLLWLPLSFLNFKYVALPERILWHNTVLVALCGIKKFFNVDVMP